MENDMFAVARAIVTLMRDNDVDIDMGLAAMATALVATCVEEGIQKQDLIASISSTWDVMMLANTDTEGTMQ